MRVKYTVSTNVGVESHDSDLHEFLLEFHYMYQAKVIPPYTVLSDLCKRDPSEWGAGNRIEWKKFNLSENDYEKALDKIIRSLDLSAAEIPEEIDSAYKWNLWQYQLTHGVPYEKHKRLLDDEVRYTSLLKQAQKDGSDDEVMLYHLKSLQAADEVSDFLQEYLSKSKPGSG
ncbi:hypothetical protein DV711_16905 [Motiliproteus coralliicola]|uniref:Uncharacterized protein n=1 Tax=Motiliproteus coralliicola TaxID=2283196 RepID=A0A369W9J3_9GAMM|nr:hypothetical protein [Motiliproteus coralliicola]RDE18337.1 hypothetical protein DV711_16905 [Motiliproteus coralliicola]